MPCRTGSRMLLQLSILALFLLSMAGHSPGSEGNLRGPVTHLPRDIEQVLWWLPEETEAVVVSRGNVPTGNTSSTTAPWGPGSRAPQMDDFPKHTCEDLVAMTCIDPLVHCYPSAREHQEMAESLFGRKTASLFVKGVWWREDSTREVCDIIVFRDNTASRIFELLKSFPSTPRRVDGVEVLEIDLDHGDADEHWQPVPFDLNDLVRPRPSHRRYLAALSPSVYVAATSPELLSIVNRRMKGRYANRALPPELPVWRHVDPTVPAWGIRHYRPALADKAPLSMAKWDTNAEGLVFFCGSSPSPFVCLKYMSKSEDAGTRFLRMKANWRHIRDISTMLPMQRVNADCVETRLRINVPETEAKRDRWSLNIVATSRCLAVTYLPLLGFSCPELAMLGE